MTDNRSPDPTPADGPIDELLGAYALSALDASERARVDEALDADPDARREAERLIGAASWLTAAEGPEGAGPAHLWDRIAAALPEQSGPHHVASEEIDELAGPRERRSRRSPGARRPRPLVAAMAAAAVVAAAAVAAIAVGVSRSGGSTELSLDQQLERTVERLRAQTGTHVADLTTSDGSVAAEVVIDAEGRGYLLDKALPALTDGRVYQLWSLDNGQAVSLGLLGGHPSIAVVGTGIPQQMAITVEPPGGSLKATTSAIRGGPADVIANPQRFST